MNSRHWPLIGITIAVCLLVVAAAHYPGGTTFSADTIGYDWSSNFISSLFRPNAINGASNPARFYAIPAIAIYSLSLGILFWRIARQTLTTGHRKIVQIAGVGSAVYTAFIVTPMHDMMVTIALAFVAVTLFGLLHYLALRQQWGLFAGGVVCLVLYAGSAFLYYRHLAWELLPIAQKLTHVAWVVWLFVIYYRPARPEAMTAATT